MTVWEPNQGRITHKSMQQRSNHPEVAKDNGDVAWRALHIPTSLVLPIKFGREIDAKRACELLKDRAAGLTDRFAVRDSLLAEFGSFEELKKYLVANCCAW